MKLFGNKESKKTCCCENPEKAMQAAEAAKSTDGLKILGSGCAKCTTLEKAVQQAVSELGLDLNIEHVRDFAQIASYGVMSTPALVLDSKVISYGKVLSSEEVKALLKKNGK